MSEKHDQHSILAAIKDLAIELGRTPTVVELCKKGVSARQVLKAFGSHSAACIAAGLEPNHARKVDGSIFERNIEKHVEAYQATVSHEKPKEAYQRCVFIPDVHFPFPHLRTLEKIYRFIEREKPDVIVQVGDLFDMYSHGRFPRSHNIFTPREEYALGKKQAEVMWAEVARAAPTARRVQLTGNHDVRPLKRIIETYPEAEDWISEIFGKIMTFDGVETILDPRQELPLPGDVSVFHGYRSKLGDHRDFVMSNAVVGHQHVGGCVFRNIKGRVLWELNCGLAGDPAAKGLSYTPQKITNWTLGFGFLDADGPRFIPCG